MAFNDKLWVEEYRPKDINDIILPQSVRLIVDRFVEEKSFPNLLIKGPPGVGKTTLALALCNTLGCDILFINGSDDRNIDVLREKMTNYVTSLTFGGEPKVVVIDEADYLNPNSTQPALRAFMEKFSDNVRFIFTVNYPEKLIPPLRSRLSDIDVKYDNNDELKEAKLHFAKRVIEICRKHELPVDNNSLSSLININAPDWRKILNQVQRGFIKTDNQIINIDSSIHKLSEYIINNDYTGVVNILSTDLARIDMPTLCQKLYDKLGETHENILPQLILTINEYQYRHAFVADYKLNRMAMCAQLMLDIR